MPLQKVPEVENGGFVRDEVVTQFDPGKAAPRLAVVEGFFGRRVAHCIPILNEINA